MKVYFGYVQEETEIAIYKSYIQIQNNLEKIKQVLSMQDILDLQEEAELVFVHDEIVQSVSNLVRATRVHEGISVGASTRSGITFIKCLKANALVNGRSFVIEDDMQEIAVAVLDHRLVYKNKEAKQTVLKQLLAKEMDRLSKLKLN
jgi:MoxR-like ATPase